MLLYYQTDIYVCLLYTSELEEVTRELNKKNETLEILENKINEISTNTDKSNSKIDIEEELRYMTEAKNKAEKEKARLESNMEKMKQQLSLIHIFIICKLINSVLLL